MEEEEKNPPTSDSNPNGDEQVTQSDIKDGGANEHTDQAKEGDKTGGQSQAEEDADKSGNQKHAQDRETDAQNAERRRRQKEREAAKQRELEERIRRQAVFDVKSGQVTADELKELSLGKVETEDQLFLVESLRKAKADGSENPLADAYKALFRKQESDKAEASAKAEAQRKAEEAKRETVARDQQAFKAKFGKTTAEVMKTDEEFMSLFGNLIDQEKGNFTELYSAYVSMKKQGRDDAKRDGSFPAGSKGGNPGEAVVETDEEFKKRYIQKYGHW